MIIGVAGFSWSGSGAVMDYLMEFEETQVYTPELILAFHSDGLHDLDVNLNEMKHKEMCFSGQKFHISLIVLFCIRQMVRKYISKLMAR